MLDAAAHRAVQQVAHAGDAVSLRSSARGSSRCRRENDEQLIGQLGAALGGRPHVAEPLHQLAVDARLPPAPFSRKRDVAQHDGQQIVEVVRDAGGELPDRLQPLHLPQRRFDPLALLDLRQQLAVRGRQLGGALLHPRFELLVEPPAFVLPQAAAQIRSARR